MQVAEELRRELQELQAQHAQTLASASEQLESAARAASDQVHCTPDWGITLARVVRGW